MPVATKSLKCPSCGAKSPAGSDRCRICTRTLPQDSLASQAAYREDMYARPVRGEAPARRSRSLMPLVVLLVAALVAWNYFELGYGPSWAHRTSAHQPGGNWRTFTGVEGLTVFLPGDPITDGVSTSTGYLRRARVGVDDHWDAILDASVLSSAAQREAESGLDATLTVGTTAAPGDVMAQGAALVAALLPGAKLTETAVVPRGLTAFGTDYDVVAAYSGYPDRGSHGTVRARITIAQGRTWLAATFYAGQQSVDLQDHLIAGFRPDGAPAPSGDGG
jgi:hypothetical protein